MGRTIVVVEDEELIADSVAARLRAEGFETAIAADGPGGVELCARLDPDLVVLDLMLPGFDGIEVCRRIQAERPIPVLILTARDTETDLLVGLGVGADDYMTKPFSSRELVARVHALLRRAERSSAMTDREAGEERISIGELEVDPAGRRARIAGQEVHLTPIEFGLVERLARRPGVVFSREQLLAEVWGYSDGGGQRMVDTHVASLRRKLGAGAIRTVRGVGYALGEPRG